MKKLFSSTNDTTYPQVCYPYGTTNDGGIQYNQQMLEQVSAISMNVIQSNVNMQNYVSTVEKRLSDATRKKRHSRTSRSVIVNEQGHILLLDTYDDGFQSVVPFIMNIGGEWLVYRLKFLKVENQQEKFAIVFPTVNLWIIGNCDSINGKKLYESFIKVGIQFNPEISQSNISDVLFRHFAPLIDNCKNEWILPELAGWNDKKFYDKVRVPFSRRQDFPMLPILEKEFNYRERPQDNFKNYFIMINNIRRRKDQILCMVYPIMGILASILANEGIKKTFFVNFVMIENDCKENIIKMFQIFNRNINQSIEANLKDKHLREELLKVNDEILILDAAGVGTQYKNSRGIGNIKRVAEKICRRGNASFRIRRDIYVGLISFTNALILDMNELPVFVSEEFLIEKQVIEENLIDEAVESFLTAFIQFAERSIEEISGVIRKYRMNIADDRIAAMQAVWSVLKEFWCTEGIDICQILDFKTDIDFSKFFDEMLDPEETVESFIRIIRREIQRFEIQDKQIANTANDNMCYFSSEYLWISPYVLNQILGKSGMLPYKYSILTQLKHAGELITDKEGLTKRLQIGGKRFETYMFKKHVFNNIGLTDIIDLTGGITK